MSRFTVRMERQGQWSDVLHWVVLDRGQEVARFDRAGLAYVYANYMNANYGSVVA